MADDGMILNFDFDNIAPVQQHVTFKGKWRDRKQAQRDFKRRQEQQNGGSDAAATGDRPAKRPRADDARIGSDGRPNKRHIGGVPGASSSSSTFGGRPISPGAAPVAAGRPQNGVTSRLFTAIPQHTTDFDEEEAKTKDDEPSRPSNAPLSDEAATFLALGLSRRIARQLSEFMHLKAPTAIQKNAVTQLVGHDSDAFLQAETGSGKTLAYLLPIVQRLMALSEDNNGVRRKDIKLSRNMGLFAIVLAPTRELCIQIAAVLKNLLNCAPWLQSTAVLGGENKHAEKSRLRKGVNILVATPGRLTDHLDNTDVLDLSRIRWLVLDEGDKLMEMGFEKDIKAIVSKIRASGKEVAATTRDNQTLPAGILPARRVTVLCSATMQSKTIKLGEMTLEDAVHVTSIDKDASKEKKEAPKEAKEANETNGDDKKEDQAETAVEETETAKYSAPSQLKQTYAIVPPKVRLVTLIGLLRSAFARKDSVMKAIVFISSADSVDFHFDLLREFGDNGKPIKTKTPAVEASTDEDSGKSAAALIKKAKMDAAAALLIASTVAPAAYITSPANRTVMLHKLHGNFEQSVRTATLDAFRNETKPCLLIATDILARGLDVPDVDLVIEYDPAMVVDDHMHRIGRTARAGRPGSATLFLQPGCEEKYIGFVKAKTSVHHPQLQLFDKILQKGYTAPVELPSAFTSEGGDNVPAEHDPSLPQQSWTKRSEALQLHIEQRLLKSAADVVATGANADGAPANKWQDKKKDKKEKEREKREKERKEKAAVTNPTLLDAARQAFKSSIRAYATHTMAERKFFDKERLQLGHMAKSFGLREAPGSMRGGTERQAAKKRATAEATASGLKQHSKPKKTATTAPKPNGAESFSDDDFGGAVEDEEAVKRMQQKMAEMMNNPAAEFNIG
ncbi:ATP-dependent RNA helicase dbp7 [Sporothrix eucalyptigena]